MASYEGVRPIRSTMQINDISATQLQASTLAIGSFDGVHRGHSELIRKMAGEASRLGVPAVALTFFPHPAVVLKGQKAPVYLTSPDERANLLEQAGAQVVVTQRFDKAFSQWSAATFLEQVFKHLAPCQIWMGEDFAFGHRREGNREFLLSMQAVYGFSLHVVEPEEIDGAVVSSTRVRTAMKAGEMEQVARLLGRPYSIEGRVVPGAGRGRKLGIPTANVALWEEQLLPPAGVYAGYGRVGEEAFPAVINLGIRPTFDAPSQPLTMEAHLLDFDGDIYDRRMRLAFHTRLRGEQRFNSADELQEQIRHDIVSTRTYLQETRDG